MRHFTHSYSYFKRPWIVVDQATFTCVGSFIYLIVSRLVTNKISVIQFKSRYHLYFISYIAKLVTFKVDGL